MGKQPRRSLDAAIVGGGLMGYLLGASLADAGMHVAVLELHGRIEKPNIEAASLLCTPMLEQVESAHGLDVTRMHMLHLEEQRRALTSVSLPYVQSLPAYAFAQTADVLPQLTRQHSLLSGLHLPVSIAPDAGGAPFPVMRSLLLPGQAVVNLPLWLDALRGSIRRLGGRIYTDVRQLSLDGMELHTGQIRLEAPHIILTTDKPLGLRSRKLLALLESRLLVQCELAASWPLYSMQQSADGMFRLLPTPRGAVALWDVGRVGSGQPPRQHRRFLHFLSACMPDWQQGGIQHSTQVHSIDGLPFIGILPGTRYLFACGYGDCPVLGAMHAADVLSRRILGQLRPEDRLYEPGRAVPGRLLNRAVLRNARRYATSMLRPNAPTCSHCGCRMRYFPPDQGWGCPWCGSGYTIFGRPVSGPAMRSARISARQRPV